MVIGAILAGGVGQRMGSTMPKQFLPLGDEPILVKTLKVFLACDKLDVILLAVNGDWLDYTVDLLEERDLLNRVRLVEGGSTRTETLCRIMDEAAAIDPDAVLVTHDAVRPFIDVPLIEENIAVAERDGCCGTAMPMVDSVIFSEDGQSISAMPDRSRYFRMQTPQSFRLPLLKAAFRSLTDDQKASLTDGCNICVLAGHPVSIVTGREHNLKITTSNDYRIAQMLEEELTR